MVENGDQVEEYAKSSSRGNQFRKSVLKSATI